METLIDFGGPKQNGFEYPMPLTEKYLPRRIEDFIGLEGPKRVFENLLKAPRPVAVLLVGPPGCGKTALAMAFADQLPGTLHHISSQKCDVAALPQLHFLPRFDGTASLKPKFGGGWERGSPLPVIWIFTCNGRGEEGTTPPGTFEPRFLSRCLVVACGKPEATEIGEFLRRLWSLEGGDPSADHSPLAEGCDGIRDALTKLEVALCTGILPSRSEKDMAPNQKPSCSGRV